MYMVLAQVMACHLFGDKAPPELILPKLPASRSSTDPADATKEEPCVTEVTVQAKQTLREPNIFEAL